MTNREINVACAEAMGWVLREIGRSTYGGRITERHWYPAGTPQPNSDGYFDGFRPSNYPRHICDADKWNPAESIADAWVLVEWLRSQPPYRGLLLTDAPSQGAGWSACLSEKRDGVTLPIKPAFAETAPLAICLAFLAWSEQAKSK